MAPVCIRIMERMDPLTLTPLFGIHQPVRICSCYPVTWRSLFLSHQVLFNITIIFIQEEEDD
jgi:hypothetical protein